MGHIEGAGSPRDIRRGGPTQSSVIHDHRPERFNRLNRIGQERLKDHVANCVESANASGDADEQRRKVAELIEVFGRGGRKRRA